MHGRRILVTGASGTLGSALARRLAPDNEVVRFDVKAPPAHKPAGFRTVVGSITDADAVATAVAGVDAIVHCAAIPGETNPRRRVVETNVMGTFLLLEAASLARVEQFVYISSIHWFGIQEHGLPVRMPAFLPIDERHPSYAVNAYGCSKVSAEYWCQWYSRRFGRSVVVIRPPLIVDTALQPTLAASALATEAGLYDYIALSDLVEAVIRTLDYRPAGGFDQFVVHAEDQRSTIPSLELVERFFPGIPADREKLSRSGGFGALFACTHARDLLGWRPQFRCKRQGVGG